MAHRTVFKTNGMLEVIDRNRSEFDEKDIALLTEFALAAEIGHLGLYYGPLINKYPSESKETLDFRRSATYFQRGFDSGVYSPSRYPQDAIRNIKNILEKEKSIFLLRQECVEMNRFIFLGFIANHKEAFASHIFSLLHSFAKIAMKGLVLDFFKIQSRPTSLAPSSTMRTTAIRYQLLIDMGSYFDFKNPKRCIESLNELASFIMQFEAESIKSETKELKSPVRSLELQTSSSEEQDLKTPSGGKIMSSSPALRVTVPASPERLPSPGLWSARPPLHQRAIPIKPRVSFSPSASPASSSSSSSSPGSSSSPASSSSTMSSPQSALSPESSPGFRRT